MLAQADELVTTAGRLSETGIVAILLFFLITLLTGIGVTVRYGMRRIFDETNGIATLWVREHIAIMNKLSDTMKENAAETNKLSDTMKENVRETKKIDSHVVRMAKMLEDSTSELSKFRYVWRHYIAALRKIIAYLGTTGLIEASKLDGVDNDLARIGIVLDNDLKSVVKADSDQ